jgi:hypothetical protein
MQFAHARECGEELGMFTVLMFSMFLTMAPAGHAEQRDPNAVAAAITLDVAPAILLPNQDIRAVVRIRPDAANRALVIELDGEYYSSTERSLDGDRAARTYEFYFHRLPAGDYVLHASVEDVNGRVRKIERHLTVIGEAEAGDLVHRH